jgi:hypothetical protein
MNIELTSKQIISNHNQFCYKQLNNILDNNVSKYILDFTDNLFIPIRSVVIEEIYLKIYPSVRETIQNLK